MIVAWMAVTVACYLNGNVQRMLITIEIKNHKKLRNHTLILLGGFELKKNDGFEPCFVVDG